MRNQRRPNEDGLTMGERIEFFVPGIPRPGGSKRFLGFGKRTGRAILVDDCKRNKEWRAMVAFTAVQNHRGSPLEGPLSLSVVFVLPRPKSHFTPRGILRRSAPRFPTVKPDRTKLLRAVEDALTGILWRDDAQIVGGPVEKVYAGEEGFPTPGVWIRVEKMAKCIFSDASGDAENERRCTSRPL